jgi:hypothetical protein
LKLLCEKCREGCFGLLRLLDVREVAGVVDFNQLGIGDILGGLAAKFRPIAERLDRL